MKKQNRKPRSGTDNESRGATWSAATSNKKDPQSEFFKAVKTLGRGLDMILRLIDSRAFSRETRILEGIPRYVFMESEFQSPYSPAILSRAIEGHGIKLPKAPTPIERLNMLLVGPNLHNRFKRVFLPKGIRRLIEHWSDLSVNERRRVNRWVLEAAFPGRCPKAPTNSASNIPARPVPLNSTPLHFTLGKSKFTATMTPSVPVFSVFRFKKGEPYLEDQAAEYLCRIAETIDQKLVQCAFAGELSTLTHVWTFGKVFAECVHDIALHNPGPLRALAASSLTMPSLRTRQVRYSYDCAKISKALRLAENCVVDMGPKASARLSSPATRFTANTLEELGRFWKQVKSREEEWRSIQTDDPQINSLCLKFRGFSLEEYLRFHFPQNPDEAVAIQKLKPFNTLTIAKWWNTALKPYLKKRETLDKIRGSPFYKSLEKAAKSGKDYHIIDELKRRCRSSMARLAKPAPVFAARQ